MGLEHLVVVVGHLPTHVRQASVAHLDSISIYSLVKGVSFREVFVQKCLPTLVSTFKLKGGLK